MIAGTLTVPARSTRGRTCENSGRSNRRRPTIAGRPAGSGVVAHSRSPESGSDCERRIKLSGDPGRGTHGTAPVARQIHLVS